MIFSKLLYTLRSRIRLARYKARHSNSFDLFQTTPHPVTLGPEQMSRFFAFIANSERPRIQ